MRKSDLQESDAVPEPPELGVRLHGPNVSREATEEAGRAMLDLLEAVAHAQGMKGKIGWQVGGVAFACDGCDLRQDFDAPRDGWSSAVEDGITNDYCPACTAKRAADV